MVDQFVGGQTAPLLRIVDVNQQQNDDYTSRTFKKEYFYPIKENLFDTIDIKICDDSGKEINFTHGKVVVILAFQKAI